MLQTSASSSSLAGNHDSHGSHGCIGTLNHYDMFGFIPVPVFSADKSSSKRSALASLIFVLFMAGYVVFTLKGFLFNNIPKTSIEQKTIDGMSFTTPKIALTYIPDMAYGISMVDQTYFGVNIYQGSLFKGLKKPKQETLLGTDYKCSPTWLPEMNFTSFLCPSAPGKLEGNLFTSDEFKYVRIDVFTCDSKKGSTGITCKAKSEIENMLKTGRFFLFIEQDSTFYQTPVNAFKALFYYPIFDKLQKYEIYLQNEQVSTEADFFYSFKAKEKEALFYNKEKTYVSELTPGQENVLITIWLRLSEESIISTQAPKNTFELVEGWGALGHLVFVIFAAYFYKHNKHKFYNRNQGWENFRKFFPSKKDHADVSIELSTTR